ncbi:type II toxin-antitoxin system prevent-host-death family antitoxin [Actinomycetospora endophytica]|uniref:Type II toxin-antitoxin system prevent-host-death family antitoxin n=1 Tax=Actinomycetospora endophytica TaxID=2291215 RepID=A0ABS8P6X3_9PSEU|nr:type II toxin-antitoxin system prevent-host-death family antitoxin [Actinomycetospora endophytica]MCD2194005.1 type II toxin-antitoxin system prevent-host-death family antitoxin [Actinomycetospora endophytica]
MAEVPVRTLNQDTAGVLARVKAGEHLAVTERGQVVAYLTPAVPAALADLVTSGRVRPPTLHGPLPRPGGPVRPELDAGALLRELRDDERG